MKSVYSYPDYSPGISSLDSQLAQPFDMAPITTVAGSQANDVDHDAQDHDPEGDSTPAKRQASKSSRGGKQTCQVCEEELKCPSDLKYVSQLGLIEDILIESSKENTCSSMTNRTGARSRAAIAVPALVL